ncbi:MAG: SGNH/GDSL hydrolase family protein, partial [Myxococcota bacterium]|nr:SGNH/GDSL hydrolase family protein [Myxococcota bacterium]
MSGIPPWIGRLGLLAGGTLFALVAVELGLRTRQGAIGVEFFLARTPELYDTRIFRRDPSTVISLVPGATTRIQTAEYDQQIRINALGMRAPEVPPRAEGELRILAVGDSFTLGLQVAEADRYTERLAVDLSERLDRPVTVWNAGVDGHGTFHAAAQARRLAPQVQADVVLYLFFSGNDIFDNLGYAKAVRDGGRPSPSRTPLHEATTWLARRSMLAMYATIAVRAFDVQGAGNGARHHQELAIFTNPAALAHQGMKTAEGLQTLASTCAALGLDCHVAVAGPAFTVHADRAEATFWLFGHDPMAVDLDAPARFVADAAPSTLAVRDLAPALRSATGGPP